ncbi:polysaccharide deacetylase family protein [Lamprobacter modestohalophilus]|uniref:Polysaccharide deacetylase family protein n=1 Tax=Lamprobacter modestohalophilus TaxID=1064514 RepID=A0A9X0W5J5_9GAMM|nr:XrtA system polysaccharide deacetylase [Lamprobacter modestohalophilus]MBK1617393.1 polysaccharide deacetylase family protein [Lamprobacter modestohalophilus]
MDKTSTIVNALSIDVEDYFQVSAFEAHIHRDQWSQIDCRVERNINEILALLDEHQVRATFFTLGWIAERFPKLVRQMADQGHEVASHGYDHVRVTMQSRDAFARDIQHTKKLLEDTCACPITGYRAASYSINRTNLWAHEEILNAGHRYSSSVYPIHHDLYGIPDAPRFAFRPLPGAELVEIPVTTVEIGKRRIPCGGGGFFRLYPYPISRWMINRVNAKEQQSAIFYFHPWEIDAGQPRLPNLPWKTRFRHYLNLDQTKQRLGALLRDFKWAPMNQVFFDKQQLIGDIPQVSLH